MRSSLRRLSVTGGALLGATGVLMGAFGSHVLESTLSAGSLDSYHVAVRYQLVHAVLLVALGALPLMESGSDFIPVSFLGGTVLFSGSIYVLTLTDMSWPAPLTPLGGVLLIVGWVLLFIRCLKPVFAGDD